MDNKTLETCKDLILLVEVYCREYTGSNNATYRDEIRASVARAIEALTKCDNSVKGSAEKLL